MPEHLPPRRDETPGAILNNHHAWRRHPRTRDTRVFVCYQDGSALIERRELVFLAFFSTGIGGTDSHNAGYSRSIHLGTRT